LRSNKPRFGYIYTSFQKFFKLPFDENSFTIVFGANQKISTEKKNKITPVNAPTEPSDEKISNNPIALSLMRVEIINPKIRINKYKEVNILYILKNTFIYIFLE
jgi:hypothetical protein